MALTEPVVQRIVVNGWTYWQGSIDNTEDAIALLLQAFASSDRFLGRAAFTVTPGGLIRTSLPLDYDGGRGWGSTRCDLAKLIPCARAAVQAVVSGDVLQAARERTKYLTLGVDLNRKQQKQEWISGDHRCRPNCPPSCTHAELVAVFDTDAGDVVHWTGKSHPVEGQQHTLVHVVDLSTHLYEACSERLLILGCHDLHMFSHRGRKAAYISRKMTRKQHMRERARKFDPTVVLHHPHTTYSPRVWQHAWSATCSTLPNVHTWASGIAFCGNPKGQFDWQPWQTLDRTRCATASKYVVDIDIVIQGCGT